MQSISNIVETYTKQGWLRVGCTALDWQSQARPGAEWRPMSSTVYANGILYRGGGVFESGSLVVADGLITQVLRADEQLPAADEVVDLEQGTLLPGFQDAHAHPLLAGVLLIGIDLLPVHDRSEYLRIIADYAAAHPELSSIEGGGWFGDVFDGGFPTAAELDAIVGDRPVILSSHDAHGVWVNSVALRLAGIDADTADPPNGRIQRDETGAPSGVLLEGATALVADLRLVPDESFHAEALLRAQERLHSVGITAWQDAFVGVGDIGPNALPAYEHLERTGQLTARVVMAQWWERTRGLEQIDDLLAVRSRFAASEGLDAGTVKVMLDGMIENGTASMIEPFEGRPDDVGITFIDTEGACELAIALDAHDFQIHFHAVGDRATRIALDAVEATLAANGQRGNRHHIAHLDIVAPADVPRFAELEVTANITALWARRDEEILTRKLPLLGAAREAMHFPFASLHRAGARLVGGSDWPVTDPNPLWSVHTATTRTGVAEDPHAIGEEVFAVPLLADEAIDLGTALDAYLSEAAYINRLDESTGVLRVGAAADLVWIDRDLRDPAALGPAVVRRTVIAGRVVYAAPAAPTPAA
jgi:predicted amidohydrolase YtcJ